MATAVRMRAPAQPEYDSGDEATAEATITIRPASSRGGAAAGKAGAGAVPGSLRRLVTRAAWWVPTLPSLRGKAVADSQPNSSGAPEAGGADLEAPDSPDAVAAAGMKSALKSGKVGAKPGGAKAVRWQTGKGAGEGASSAH